MRRHSTFANTEVEYFPGVVPISERLLEIVQLESSNLPRSEVELAEDTFWVLLSLLNSGVLMRKYSG